MNSVVTEDEQEREIFKKCYYDSDLIAIQLYDEIIDFVMLLRAGGNAIISNLKVVLES